MENKVITNDVDKKYIVQVGEHYVNYANVNDEGVAYDYNLSPKNKANKYRNLNQAKEIAASLNGKVIAITTTTVVVRNEEEVE